MNEVDDNFYTGFTRFVICYSSDAFHFVSETFFSFCMLTKDRKRQRNKNTERNDTAFDQPNATGVTEFVSDETNT